MMIIRASTPASARAAPDADAPGPIAAQRPPRWDQSAFSQGLGCAPARHGLGCLVALGGAAGLLYSLYR